MTIEEKAKAYDEAIKIAKETYNTQPMYRNWLESMFPELQENEIKDMREKLIKAFGSIGKKEWGGVNVKDVIHWLEKQGEQKPADKVEPKFKVGDWVVTSYGKVNQVIAVDEDCDGFTLDDDTYFSGSWKDSYHLWTIQDAKDGDVLVNGSNIFIFHFLNDTRLMGYCHVNIDNGRFYDDIGKNECFCLIDAVVNPATKEQCDLLFKKMSEAGYEWDAEKKELNKIEQKSAWSEEDEENLAQCIEAIDACYKWDSMIDWLKSLRSRSRWKPSEEQIKALDAVIDEYDGYPEFDLLVSLKNDLKKL